VESHLDKSIAFQIRSLRDKEGWTQGAFAEKLGIKHPNNVSARLENPNYGKHSLTTLKKIAATCDVALVVWFVPFSRLLDWVTGTPRIDNGLSEAFYDIPDFDHDSFDVDEIGLGSIPPENLKQERKAGADVDSSLPPKRSPSPVPYGPIPVEMAG
jgi:transcriptional regulator with XRE-family HTH domain